MLSTKISHHQKDDVRIRVVNLTFLGGAVTLQVKTCSSYSKVNALKAAVEQKDAAQQRLYDAVVQKNVCSEPPGLSPLPCLVVPTIFSTTNIWFKR
jgi:hypothetical protein